MKDWDGIAKLADVFFNGRKSSEEAEAKSAAKKTISAADLVSRRSLLIRAGGKLYQVTVTEVEITKKA